MFTIALTLVKGHVVMVGSVGSCVCCMWALHGQAVECAGSVAVESRSPTKDQTHITCTGRWIPNY